MSIVLNIPWSASSVLAKKIEPLYEGIEIINGILPCCQSISALIWSSSNATGVPFVLYTNYTEEMYPLSSNYAHST